MGIELTPTAAEEIRKIATQQGLNLQTVRLRVGAKGYGPQRKYILDLTDRTDADERVFESQGILIVCAGQEIPILDGATIDFREQEGVGWGFTFDLPPERQISQQVGDHSQPPPSEEKVREALYQVNDPEVGVNIVDLGLVYGLNIDGRNVRITMTMTTPACPLSGMIRQEVDQRIRQVCPGTDAVEVELVWEPKWTPQMMTAEGKRQLGWSRR